MIILKLILKYLKEGLVGLEELVHLLSGWRADGLYRSWWVQSWGTSVQEGVVHPGETRLAL
jgi:hypothetical protein